MKKVEMPKMGDTMEEGKILRWIKKEGDQVKKGEPLAEVETDKVNIEIEAFASGTLRKILVSEGTSAPIGAPIALIGTRDEPLPASLRSNGAQTTTNPPSIPASNTPQTSNIATSVTLDTLATLANLATPPTNTSGRIFISPIARRMAQEYNLNYTTLRGTGPNGRIIKMDVEAALLQQQRTASVAAPVAQPVQPAQPIPEPVPTPVTIDTGETVEIPLTAMRRTIARRLSQSMQ